MRLQVLQTGWRLCWREPAKFRLLLRMAMWVFVLVALVKFFSLQRALRWIACSPQNKSSPFTPEQIAQLLDQLLQLNLLALTPTCWKRAIILHRFLALQGLATRIVFGVNHDQEKKLAGHAWLEWQGQPLLEKVPPAYVVTFAFPA